MLKLPNPRRRSTYSRQFYNKKPKSYGRGSLIWLILALPLSVILLEMIGKVYVSLTNKDEQNTAASAVAEAYRLQFLTQNEKNIEGLFNQGDLVVSRSSSFGYQLVANQKAKFWEINAQGFRDSADVPLTKPKNEIRIFVLGGSTAFGYGNLTT